MNYPLRPPGEDQPSPLAKRSAPSIPWLEGLQHGDQVTVSVDGLCYAAIVEFRRVWGSNTGKKAFIRAPGIWVRTPEALAREKAEVVVHSHKKKSEPL